MHKIFSKSQLYTQALLESLRSAPLLVDDLPEAVCFDRSKFFHADELPELNFSQKLGHLYEDALAYVLESTPNLDLTAQSVQVFNDDKITLGELDFILKDLIKDEYIHLELAVKFYLIVYEDGQPRYPGPDPRDNWLNKLARMREHQLQFVKSDFAQRCLLEKYDISEVTTQHLVYGKLFDHYKSDQKPCPPAMHADCLRGTWMYLHEWEEESTAEQVAVVPKCLWPVAIENLLGELDVVLRADFVEEVTQRCVMVWDEGRQMTLFVTPNTWAKS